MSSRQIPIKDRVQLTISKIKQCRQRQSSIASSPHILELLYKLFSHQIPRDTDNLRYFSWATETSANLFLSSSSLERVTMCGIQCLYIY